MRTDRALSYFSTLATAMLIALTSSACEEPPAAPSDQIEIDAESRALDESVEQVREKADERVASPDESTKDSHEEDDAPTAE